MPHKKKLFLGTLIIVSILVATSVHADVNLNGLTYQWANWNTGAVSNNPLASPTFTLDKSVILTYIDTYHWNNGRGVKPGKIGLIDGSGKRYGPWQAVGLAGQGGTVPDALWVVRPNEKLPAGTYIVTDSSPETWSFNSKSGNAGFAGIQYKPVDSNGGTQEKNGDCDTSMTLKKGKEYSGGDYDEISDTTTCECAQKCEDDDNCKAFTWMEGGMCWLKDGINKLIDYTGAVSGAKGK